MTNKRTPAEEKKLRDVWDKTNGHCHFCGDPLVFENYGSKGGEERWVLERTLQSDKGGDDSLENLLAAHWKCNDARWHYSGNVLRNIIAIGRIANEEIEKSSAVGKLLVQLREKKAIENAHRSPGKDA